MLRWKYRLPELDFCGIGVGFMRICGGFFKTPIKVD